MKKFLAIFTLLVAFCLTATAQSPVRLSSHSGYMFSFGNFERNNVKLKNITRFTAVINFGVDAHWLKDNFGVSLGLETHNLGMIMEDTLNVNQNVRTKHRVYTLGAPLTLMFGNMEKNTYFYVGGQYEYTFDYKEKVFVGGDKQYKSKGDYTYNVNRWLPSLFAGIQLKTGTYLKFQYYMTDFFDDKYQFTYTQGTTKIYPPMTKSQLYFVELGHRVFLDKPDAPSATPKQTRAVLRSEMASMY